MLLYMYQNNVYLVQKSLSILIQYKDGKAIWYTSQLQNRYIQGAMCHYKSKTRVSYHK